MNINEQIGNFFLFQIFCALFSLLVTSLMLFLDISHIALMFPFNWGKLVSMLVSVSQINRKLNSNWLLLPLLFSFSYATIVSFENLIFYSFISHDMNVNYS